MSDFRSDTVTRPTAGMKQAMLDAPLGDDVFGDDPSVNHLQQSAAELLGFEAALFAPSGTQSNLIALLTHCQRGDEAIVGQLWHTYRWEAGGMAVLGSIQPQPLEHQPDGSLALDEIEAAIKPDDPHFARTRLVTLENTIGGKVLPMAYMRAVQELALRRGLLSHIDGARLFNAAVAIAHAEGGSPIQRARELCAGYDSLSLCLSKGLGAPVGSLLLGSRDFIARARRARKMLGGGMRQAGMLAAAGTYALQHHIDRLGEDHALAAGLGAGLRALAADHPVLGGKMVVHPVQTNIVMMDVHGEVADGLLAYLARENVRITSSYQARNGAGSRTIRWVTHLDVGKDDVERALAVVAAWKGDR
jgi:threonine aldolase